jgi:hypothetical protein
MLTDVSEELTASVIRVMTLMMKEASQKTAIFTLVAVRKSNLVISFYFEEKYRCLKTKCARNVWQK